MLNGPAFRHSHIDADMDTDMDMDMDTDVDKYTDAGMKDEIGTVPEFVSTKTENLDSSKQC